MSDKYRQSKNYFLVYAELINAARRRGTVTYQELAEVVGLPLRGSHMGRELGMLLGAVSEDEVHLGRPMLSAVAINVSGSPGDGFFALAKELGLFNSSDPQAQKQFWEDQKQQVYETWKREFKK